MAKTIIVCVENNIGRYVYIIMFMFVDIFIRLYCMIMTYCEDRFDV